MISLCILDLKEADTAKEVGEPKCRHVATIHEDDPKRFKKRINIELPIVFLIKGKGPTTKAIFVIWLWISSTSLCPWYLSSSYKTKPSNFSS